MMIYKEQELLHQQEFLGALKISGEKLTDQRYMCLEQEQQERGIADRIYQEMLQQGLSENEARNRFLFS